MATASSEEPDQQVLLGLDVVRLKGLVDVTLNFKPGLTAIMGSNGSGKTTVLHALACAYKKPLIGGGFDYRFPQFFRPNTDALWKDSDFTIRYSQRLGKIVQDNLQQHYTKATDRWSPRYEKRPTRYTRLVSIGESVPDIEAVALNSMIHYEKQESTDEVTTEIRKIAGEVLNRKYESLYNIKYDYLGRPSIGVKTSSVTYSGLSMSSGEQRAFRILEAIWRAPKYALILVDEIDLFLHQDALQRLLDKLHKHCVDKNKQLIFTSHFPPVAKMYDKMCIYSLNRLPSGTIVWLGYSYEALCLMTGSQERPVSIYVEDDVATQIVGRVAAELSIRKFVQIERYGPAANAFTLCYGLIMAQQSTDRILAVLDGDVYGHPKDRRKRVEAVLTGNYEAHKQKRRVLARLVRTLKPLKENGTEIRYSPEQMLHTMILGLPAASVDDGKRELFKIAQNVINVPEKHGFIDEIIARTGESRDIALHQIVELASCSPIWNRYTRLIRAWLKKQKTDLTGC